MHGNDYWIDLIERTLILSCKSTWVENWIFFFFFSQPSTATLEATAIIFTWNSSIFARGSVLTLPFLFVLHCYILGPLLAWLLYRHQLCTLHKPHPSEWCNVQPGFAQCQDYVMYWRPFPFACTLPLHEKKGQIQKNMPWIFRGCKDGTGIKTNYTSTPPGFCFRMNSFG